MRISKFVMVVIGMFCIINLSSCSIFSQKTNSESAYNLKEQNTNDSQHIVMFGDSITQKDREINESYADTVAKLTDFKVTNVGLGGTAMSVHQQADYNMFSF